MLLLYLSEMIVDSVAQYYIPGRNPQYKIYGLYFATFPAYHPFHIVQKIDRFKVKVET